MNPRRFGYAAVAALLAANVPVWAADHTSAVSRERILSEAPAVQRARDVAPDALLNAVTAEVIAVLKQETDAGSQVKISDLVEARILPMFDFARMARITMARNWRLASPEQQTSLILEFKALLVRTYSAALSNYRDQVIEFRPLRLASGESEVTVKSEVMQSGREQMTIDYDMEKTAAGWKIYDIKVGGVSLVTAYRETFADKVRDGGVDGLIKSLSDRNRQGESRFRSYKTAFMEQSRQIFAILHSALTGGR